MSPQRYIYSGPYREFRGYVFRNGLPVTVTDRGTLEAIRREPDFKEVRDETPPKAAPAPEVLRRPIALAPDECPKCHRIIGQGKWLHQKYCKGRP